MRFKNYLCIFSLVVLTIAACKKNNPKPKPELGVYVAGSIRVQSGNYVAAYWRNNVQVTLTDGSFSAKAYAIKVVGTDIYVVGTTRAANGAYIATYWKNGVITNLTDNSSIHDGLDIAVNGSDVYVSGYTVSP